MIEHLKQTLSHGDYTIVVGNPSSGRVFTSRERGVKALVNLIDTDSALLRGASIADKVVGRAAAALMIRSGVSRVHSRVITSAAVAMLLAAGITVDFDTEVDMIANRTRTGRCPLDTLCAPLSHPAEMEAAIRRFYKELDSRTSI